MRIQGPGRSTAPSGGLAARRADPAGAAFAPAAPGPSPRATASPAGAAALSGLDALIALQAVESEPPRGRRRAIRRGHDLLDVLEEIRVAVLSGTVTGSALDRIASLLGEREPTGDAGLDGVLGEIALRAEVELAKRGRYLDPGEG